MFVKHRCPRWQQSQNMVKISKSYILTPLHSQGHVMSVNCEEPIDEPTVQVWLLYHHPNFKYCTLFESGTELRTDKQTDKQTDDPITRCPRQTFQAGGIINSLIRRKNQSLWRDRKLYWSVLVYLLTNILVTEWYQLIMNAKWLVL